MRMGIYACAFATPGLGRVRGLEEGMDHIVVPAEFFPDVLRGHHGHSRWTHGYLSLELASLLPP
jgi:hypothetical protein